MHSLLDLVKLNRSNALVQPVIDYGTALWETGIFLTALIIATFQISLDPLVINITWVKDVNLCLEKIYS